MRSQQCMARRQRPVGELLHKRTRARTLDGEHREVGLAVAHVGVELLAVGLHPGEVPCVIGGVGDRQEAALPEPVGDEVVEHAALLVAEQRVLGAARREPADVA